jgi:glycerol-3-phosphate dehydrogenase
MWNRNWRDHIWENIDQAWDIIVIGGGITGAGILREAARLELRALLVEQKDFAWGTSSRSSKLVHGGLRYLKEGKLRFTRDSVREREHLLNDGPGLIEPIDFLLATYDGEHPGRLMYSAGLTIYDLLALRWSHRHYDAQSFKLLAGQLTAQGLEGGFRFGDAQTDDARLVLRIIREAVAHGAEAINYVKAESLIRAGGGRVSGIQLRDQLTGFRADIEAKVIINASGAWADRIRADGERKEKIRPLRGSHLIFPSWRIPAAQAVTFLHPLDQRPVFVLPWEGVTLVGTTDEDYHDPLNEEPSISGHEVAYLMMAVDERYPSLEIGVEDILCTFSGIRPVIDSGKDKPSEESRDHVIWSENGMITVTGGKLTTFRLIAKEVMDEVREQFADLPAVDEEAPILDLAHSLDLDGHELDEAIARRLQGRYGAEAGDLIEAAENGELETIAQTHITWAELRWAARSEGVVHLDDLLLRRVRLGLVTENGGSALLDDIRAICQLELGWSDRRWEEEVAAYRQLWRDCYSLPPLESIPQWRRPYSAQETMQQAVNKEHTKRMLGSRWTVSIALSLLSLAVLLSWRFMRRR